MLSSVGQIGKNEPFYLSFEVEMNESVATKRKLEKKRWQKTAESTSHEIFIFAKEHLQKRSGYSDGQYHRCTDNMFVSVTVIVHFFFLGRFFWLNLHMF